MIYLAKKELTVTDDRFIEVTDEDAHYLFKVRRVGREEPVYFYCDGVVYETVIAEARRSAATFAIQARHAVPRRGPRVQAVLAMIEWSRLEESVRNGVEAGANGFYLFKASRSTLPESAPLKRFQRLEQIIESAASQSRRRCLPTIRAAGRDVIIKKKGRHIVFHPEAPEEATMDMFRGGDEDIYVWIGPEGGFGEEEELFFRKAGTSFAALRTPVLRVENAVTFAVGLARHAVGYTAEVTLPE